MGWFARLAYRYTHYRQSELILLQSIGYSTLVAAGYPRVCLPGTLLSLRQSTTPTTLTSSSLHRVHFYWLLTPATYRPALLLVRITNHTPSLTQKGSVLSISLKSSTLYFYVKVLSLLSFCLTRTRTRPRTHSRTQTHNVHGPNHHHSISTPLCRSYLLATVVLP